MKRIKKESVWDPDCSRYLECLTQAAHDNKDMHCNDCPMKNDSAGRISMDTMNGYVVSGQGMVTGQNAVNSLQ